ncbi:MAG: hypothetical protein ABS92_06790 [Thiobacillus sp. SCN 63-374]|nr:MAG: hypothetical protein ABS92_06790 [Thiobacillus sp. SCN 63-374]
MAGKNLELALKIKAIVEGLKNVTGLNQEVDKLGAKAAKPIPDPTPELRAGADRTTAAVGALGKSLAGLASIAAIQQFVRGSVNEFAKAEAAFRGLEAVANYSGVGIGRALQEAQKLAADGSMTVAESSKALQNLLSRGYNIDQAVQTLTRLKDAAAFNRAANLSMGEAVVSATEGLKNENSILVDNAGVTKNVSVMWEEYAASIGKSTSELTKQEKIEAENVGIKRETAAQLGNAAKAADGFAGQMNKADAEMKKFGASMGQILAPAVAGLATVGTWLIENVAKPVVVFFQRVGVAAAGTAVNLGLIWDAILSGDFSGVWGKLAANTQMAKDQMKELGDEMQSGKLDFKPLGDGAKKAAKDTTEATADMGKAVKQQAKDRKDSVNEQVKDAEKLRDALIKAFDDSLQAEKSFRDQAKKLRAEASQKPQDSSVEGQASATLDLIAAEQQLQRMKNSAPLEDVQAQAEQVRRLAENLDDQARAQDAVNRSKLAEADALDRAANGEKTQQAGITEQQRVNEERLKLFQGMLKDLEAGKTVKVEADTQQASTALEQVKVLWDAIQDKTVTLTVNQAGAAAPGAIPGHATGTILPGYGGGDRRLILAEDGEAITRKEAVAYYGRSFMAALNARQIPRFANGGIVSDLVSSGMSSGGSGLQPVTLNMPGAGAFAMSAAPDVVAELKNAIAREALKHGRR